MRWKSKFFEGFHDIESIPDLVQTPSIPLIYANFSSVFTIKYFKSGPEGICPAVLRGATPARGRQACQRQASSTRSFALLCRIPLSPTRGRQVRIFNKIIFNMAINFLKWNKIFHKLLIFDSFFINLRLYIRKKQVYNLILNGFYHIGIWIIPIRLRWIKTMLNFWNKISSSYFIFTNIKNDSSKNQGT